MFSTCDLRFPSRDERRGLPPTFACFEERDPFLLWLEDKEVEQVSWSIEGKINCQISVHAMFFVSFTWPASCRVFNDFSGRESFFPKNRNGLWANEGNEWVKMDKEERDYNIRHKFVGMTFLRRVSHFRNISRGSRVRNLQQVTFEERERRRFTLFPFLLVSFS